MPSITRAEPGAQHGRAPGRRAPVSASVSVTMRLRVLVAVPVLALLPSLASACSEQAEGSQSWELAVHQVERLTEVNAWRRYVSQRPPAKVTLLPAVDRQSLIAGHCYWSVTLYSDEGTNL